MCKKLYNDIQLIFLQEGSNRILSREPKSFVSHMNCFLQEYTTDQFTYFIYYLFEDKFKKIQKLSKSNKYIKRYIQNNIIILFILFSHLNLK